MKKILIASASDVTNKELSKALSQYKVDICSTGTEALTMLELLQPDILILDLMLPAMDGLTVLQKTSVRPPIILARTNIISETVLQAAARVGVQDIILIPCTIRYIVNRLNALIKNCPSLEV